MLNKTRRALVASVAVCSLALTACSNTAENARENADSAKSEVQSEAANATSAAGGRRVQRDHGDGQLR